MRPESAEIEANNGASISRKGLTGRGWPDGCAAAGQATTEPSRRIVSCPFIAAGNQQAANSATLGQMKPGSQSRCTSCPSRCLLPPH